jgi:hypothetical protein
MVARYHAVISFLAQVRQLLVALDIVQRLSPSADKPHGDPWLDRLAPS